MLYYTAFCKNILRHIRPFDHVNSTCRSIRSKCYIIQLAIYVICNNNKHADENIHLRNAMLPCWIMARVISGVSNFRYKIFAAGIAKTKRSEYLHIWRRETDCKTDCFTISVKQRFSRNVASSVLRRIADFSISPRDSVIQRSFCVFVAESVGSFFSFFRTSLAESPFESLQGGYI